MFETDPFRAFVRAEGVRLYRDLPWRDTRDPYAIWISEVMLQQTQVPRVLTRWERWLDRFPSVFALAEAPVADVLSEWQGMGYNRRALALKSAAEAVASDYDGVLPTGVKELCALPGIGPATAQGIRSFAYDLPGVYLETNVRTVFLHHFFPDVPAVPDRELVPLIARACPGPEGEDFCARADESDTPRSWYYALLDYGAYLKKTVPNPSRRSSGYTKQSRFEGSRRQKRAALVRELLAAREEGVAERSLEELAAALNGMERAAGRPPVPEADVRSILDDLAREGFCRDLGEGSWGICL